MTCTKCEKLFEKEGPIKYKNGNYHVRCLPHAPRRSNGPKQTIRRDAIDLLKKRALEIYGGKCKEIDDLIYEVEGNLQMTTKIITLISDALWQLR